MAKRHMKRVAAPRTWGIERKKTVFVARPNPGAHSFELGMSLSLIMREMIGIAKTNREVRSILLHKTVLVDGAKRTDGHFLAGLFDTISFPDVDRHYRIVLNSKGKLAAVSIDKAEAALKVCKIAGKSKVAGKTQVNLSDGRNIIVEKDEYKTGDSLLVEVPKQTIKKHFKLAKGALVYLTGGKHIGSIGVVEAIEGSNLMYKAQDGSLVQTSKRHAFVLGDSKSAITIAEKK